MNKVALLVLAAIPAVLPAQQIKHNPDGSYYRKCSSFSISRPIRDLVAEHNAKAKKAPKVSINREAPDSERYVRLRGIKKKRVTGVSALDGALQSKAGTASVSPPFENFDGQQSSGGYVPLDPNGMIGKDYYVQTVNINYAVYDKKGDTVLNATDFTYLFSGFDYGDPVTVYDKMADRWLITQIGADADTLDIAVSVTNDPTGSFYIYKFCPESTDFDDYPKYAVWADGYYQTCNCADNDNVTIYNRAQMLAGDSNAGFIVVPWYNSPWAVNGDSNTHGTGDGEFFCPMMLDADGELPPYGSPEYLFFFTDDNWGAPYKDAIIINKISVDWTTQTGTVTVDDTLPTAAFDSYFTGIGGRADLSQPNDQHSLDVLNGFISYRIPYMRWSSYNSAVMSYPVDLDTTNLIAGIRWYELHQDAVTMKWSIYQQSTFGPDDRVSRWNPGIAMDKNGNIALAYSVTDSNSIYPGIRYTGRRACDPLNTMTFEETTVCTGDTNAYTELRWGDYSLLSLDPTDGTSFWYTNMYAHSGYGMFSNVGTRICAFSFPYCNPGGSTTVEPGLTAYQNGGNLVINATGLIPNQNVNVDLFDALGKHLNGTPLSVPYSGNIQTTINISTLARAIYIVRVGNDNFQRVVKVPVM